MADCQCQDCVSKTTAKYRSHGNRKQGSRNRLDYIQDTHDYIFKQAAVIPDYRTQNYTEKLGYNYRYKPERQGISGTVQQTAEYIPSQVICSA